jgi:hypothetical protein
MPSLDSLGPKHLIAVCTLALAACGGGGGSSGPSAAPTPSLTLSGVAAVGAALANAPVQAKCGSGTGSAVTAADGSFTIKIVGGVLPCVLEVASAGGGKLHSVIDGASSGSGATSADVNVNCNITPLTELVAAKAAGGAPAALFANFDAAAQAKVGTAELDAAVASVAAALQGVIDLNGVNPIKDTLVVGNALDQKLDTLQLVLSAAQTTLSELATAIASGGSGTSVIQGILQPAAASCAGLRSGTYRAIIAYEPVNLALEPASFLVNIDAVALTAISPVFSPDPVTLTPVAGQPCMFTSPGDFGPDSDTLLVSKSGMGVLRSLSSTGQPRTRYLIPEQNLPLSELAGNWNLLEYWPDDITHVYAPGAGTTTFDANGNFTDILECAGLGSCVPGESNPGSLQVLEAGGFGVVGSTEGTVVFAFKTASGQMSIFLVNPTIGGFTVGTKQAALSLPAVGDVSNLWNFTIGSNSFASALSAQVLTVSAVDAVAGSYSRTQASDGRIDSFTINSPRNGLRYRAAGSSPVNGGGTVAFNEIITMPLADTGILFYTSVNPADNFFGISVGKP